MTFEYAGEESTVLEGKGVKVSAPSIPALLGAGQPVSADLAGALQPHTKYFYRAIVTNSAGTTENTAVIQAFETENAAKPTLSGEEATSVTATSATLDAKLDPEGLPITACTFEYGTDTSYGHPVPCAHPDAAELGAGRSPVPVSVPLTELKPEVTYHWRLTASNAAGTETGPDHTFIDEPAAGLPDGRAYEMVTPPDKNGSQLGAAFGDNSGFPPLIAPNGGALMAFAVQCFAHTESCTPVRNKEGDPYEFHRTPTEGWVTNPLAPSATAFAGAALQAADVETHTALFTATAPSSQRDDFYVGGGPGALADIGPVEQAPGSGLASQIEESLLGTRDFSHVVFGTHNLWSLDGELENLDSVYEYVGTGNRQPLAVGVTGPQGSTTRIAGCTYFGDSGSDEAGTHEAPDGSLSESGRTIYFTAQECQGAGGLPELYARVDGERSDAHTVAISRPVASSCGAECQSAPDQGGGFVGASHDGSRVLFVSTGQLTDNASRSTGRGGQKSCSGTSGTGCNLYESVCAEPCGKPGEEPKAAGRELLDLSEGAKETGGPRVQDVMPISADGSHVYFVALGVLTQAANARGQKAQDGHNNLYVHVEGQPLKFIATDVDNEEGLVSNVTPDGRFLVFLSGAALTSDDTRPQGPSQVYRYDAQTGALVRISIGSNGYNDNGNSGSASARFVEASKGFFGVVGPARADPTMSDNGEYVFFQSPVALAPGALNEVEIQGASGRQLAENIYEYHDGAVSLIAAGAETSPPLIGENGTNLIGTDATGANVFFAIAAQLTTQDISTEREYYDARICTTAEPCYTPPAASIPCSEEGCRPAAPASAVAQAPGSESFAGPGNLTPPPAAATGKSKPPTRQQKLAKALSACRTKHNKHKRQLCERAARRPFGAKASAKKSTKRATNDRRASR